MFPQPGDRGIYYFGVDPVSVGLGVCLFISVHYLPNQLMDFDQTRIDTLLGEGEELI